MATCTDRAECLRRQLGIPTGDVLDIIAGWPPERQAEGNKILTDIETKVNCLRRCCALAAAVAAVNVGLVWQALEELQFMPGLVELCAALDKAGVRRRGCSADTMLRSAMLLT